LASEPPLILAFDTAAAHCAAALVQGGTVLVRRDEPMARGQAERLLPMLGEMLATAGSDWPALDGLAVCTGPGNFTGLRIAVAAARGLAMALDIPAVGVTTFEALAAVDQAKLGPLPECTLCLGFDAATIAADLGLAAGPEATSADPVAMARVAARRLQGAPRPAPLYLRPADAMPPSDPVPAILDDA